MKLARIGAAGHERPAIVDDLGAVREAGGLVADWACAMLDPAHLASLRHVDLARLPLADPGERLGPPVAGVGKLIGVGLNYADHAAEAGLPLPSEPVWFLKATSALSGPHDPILIPDGGEKLDWEAELALVIGRTARAVDAAEALGHVAGYAVFNDVSERAFQLERGGQWTKGKSCDSFGPLGPWLVTPDEVGETGALEIWLDVNGERQQASSTRHLVFGVAQLVASISRYMTLHPGDVIATGTPAGVGFGKTPQRFLRAGDVVELGVARLGRQRQVVRSDAWTAQA